MTGAPSTLSAERTLLARVRTAVALVLTCAIVARAALEAHPLAAAACLAAAIIAVLSLRVRPPLSALLLALGVLVLAAVGLVGALG